MFGSGEKEKEGGRAVVQFVAVGSLNKEWIPSPLKDLLSSLIEDGKRCFSRISCK